MTPITDRLREDEQVIRAARDRVSLAENDVPRQEVILRLKVNELGHLNRLLDDVRVVAALTPTPAPHEETPTALHRCGACGELTDGTIETVNADCPRDSHRLGVRSAPVPDARAEGPTTQTKQSDLVAAVTAVVRDADRDFERSGGSSRHWVRECFLPTLNAAGFLVVRQGPPPPYPAICRHCNEELRLMDGDWRDRETHRECIGSKRRHEPAQPVAAPGAEDATPEPPHVREDYREVWLSGWRAGKLGASAPAAGTIEAKYHELLYAVVRKWPGHSRHETALRYIQQAEATASCGPASAAPGDPPQEMK